MEEKRVVAKAASPVYASLATAAYTLGDRFSLLDYGRSGQDAHHYGEESVRGIILTERLDELVCKYRSLVETPSLKASVVHS